MAVYRAIEMNYESGEFLVLDERSAALSSWMRLLQAHRCITKKGAKMDIRLTL